MMKKAVLGSTLMIVLLLAASCTSIKVVSDYDKDVDFSDYETYNFKIPEEVQESYPALVNPINQKRIEKAIAEEMELRGYEKSDDPDLWISYYVKVQDKVDYRTTHYNPSIYGPYYYGWYYGYSPGWTSVEAIQYREGTLVIDLVDAEKNQLVWYGLGSGTLNDNADKIKERIEYAVHVIFNQYPFMAGKSDEITAE